MAISLTGVVNLAEVGSGARVRNCLVIGAEHWPQVARMVMVLPLVSAVASRSALIGCGHVRASMVAFYP